jgi:hypothetical protein
MILGSDQTVRVDIHRRLLSLKIVYNSLSWKILQATSLF